MEQSRERILNAAEARLLASGPAGLVLDAIAADAGMSKGGLLYHFRTKEALVEGLCDRMLARFDEALESLSTVTDAGKPADNSARLMAGILATLGRESAHLEKVREHFARWHARLAVDGIDPTAATLVRLAADGLWLSALLGLTEHDAAVSPDVLRALRDLTRG
jgi:AcrR family transcriptional regulator